MGNRSWLSLITAGVFAIGLASAVAASSPRKITVTAKKFEWLPAKIEVKVGETIELTLESQDVKHGFSSRPGCRLLRTPT